MNRSGFIEVLIPGLIVALAFGTVILYQYVFKASDDNPVEEVAEEVIKSETGVLIDLSPLTPEKQLIDSKL